MRDEGCRFYGRNDLLYVQGKPREGLEQHPANRGFPVSPLGVQSSNFNATFSQTFLIIRDLHDCAIVIPRHVMPDVQMLPIGVGIPSDQRSACLDQVLRANQRRQVQGARLQELVFGRSANFLL